MVYRFAELVKDIRKEAFNTTPPSTLNKFLYRINPLLNNDAQALGQKNKFAELDFISDVYALVRDYHQIHIYAKKSFFGKLKYFFGFISDPDEKQLLEVRKELKVQKQILEKAIKMPWHLPLSQSLFFYDGFSYDSAVYKRKFFNATQEALKDPEMKIRVIAHQLMGNKRFNNEYFERIPRAFMLHETLNDLQTFGTQFSDISSTHPALMHIDRAIVVFAKLFEKIALLDLSDRCFSLQNAAKKELHQERLESISYDAAKEIYQLKQYERFLLPWGFIAKDSPRGFAAKDSGHAALIAIIRVTAVPEEAKFDIAFINTDKGPVNDIFQQLFTIITNQTSVYGFRNLSFNELAELLPSIFIATHTIHADIKAGIEAMFAPFVTLQKKHPMHEWANKIYLQINATCAFECNNVWLENILGKYLATQFREFNVKRNLQKLEDWINSQDAKDLIKKITSKPDQKNSLHDLKTAGEDLLKQIEQKNIQNTSENIHNIQVAKRKFSESFVNKKKKHPLMLETKITTEYLEKLNVQIENLKIETKPEERSKFSLFSSAKEQKLQRKIKRKEAIADILEGQALLPPALRT